MDDCAMLLIAVATNKVRITFLMFIMLNGLIVSGSTEGIANPVLEMSSGIRTHDALIDD
jgi:hypothetical protein